MRPLRDHLTDELCWEQPEALTRLYQLRAGPPGSGICVAVLRFETPFGSLATGQTTAGCWSFKRVGFFRPTVTVRAKGQDETIAVYQPRWTGTEGEITTGRGTYTFRTANFWATRYEIRDANGEPLVTYRSGCGGARLLDLFRNESSVTITEIGRANPLIELLVVIGWYLVILNHDDSATVVATVAATATS